jgi:uncharacterized protein (DUF58 family)
MIERDGLDDAQIHRAQRRLWLLSGGILVGSVALGAAPLIPVGIVLAAMATVREAWIRRRLRGVVYERTVHPTRCVAGDAVVVTTSLWNRSLLPLPMIITTDSTTHELRPVDAEIGSVTARNLADTWSLLPFERIERVTHLKAEDRGLIELGPIGVEVLDVFGSTVASGQFPAAARLVVVPRSLPVLRAEEFTRPRAPVRPRPVFPEDPALVSGVRAYVAGDPPRRIHWKATARTGSPQSKRYDAPHSRALVIVVDVVTHSGRSASTEFDPELLESVCVTAASLIREGLTSRVPTGLAAAAYAYQRSTRIWIPPASGPLQLGALLVALGRIAPWPPEGFGGLLLTLGRRIHRASDIAIVTSRDLTPLLPALRGLRSHGNRLRVVGVGPGAEDVAPRVRRRGIEMELAQLRPDWRTADALVLG